MTKKKDSRLTITDSGAIKHIEKIRDSMQLDSGQDIAWMEGDIDGFHFNASVRVTGEVRVTFRDQCYSHASQMPKELLDCYAAGAGPEDIIKAAESDGRKYGTPYCVDNNNWLEECLKLTYNGAPFDVRYEVLETEGYTGKDYMDMLRNDIVKMAGNAADKIIDHIRTMLMNIIRRNISLLTEDDGSADDDINVCTGDYGNGKVKFTVNVSDLRCDYDGTEERTVKEIRIDGKERITVTTEEVDDEEIPADDLSTDELTVLARWTGACVNSLS